MKHRKEIVFTEKEAEGIAECLETLAAMSGAFDEHFTKECQRAGKYADKIRELIQIRHRKRSIAGTLSAKKL